MSCTGYNDCIHLPTPVDARKTPCSATQRRSVALALIFVARAVISAATALSPALAAIRASSRVAFQWSTDE
jgi:hypothetical protein